MRDETKLPYPQWQVPLQEMLVEIDREKLSERASKAETAILERLHNLPQSNDALREREAINYGLAILRITKRDGLVP